MNAFSRGKSVRNLAQNEGCCQAYKRIYRFMMALLKMANLLGLTTPPEDEENSKTIG